MQFLVSAGILVILGVVLILIIRSSRSKTHESIKQKSVRVRSNSDSQKDFAAIKVDKINEQIKIIQARMRARHGEIPENIEYQVLIPHSWKCQELIWDRNQAILNGTNRISSDSLDREFKRILKEPLEYWTATEKYYDHFESKERRRHHSKDRTELLIKYNEIAFSIFDTYIYLTKSEIISRIVDLLKLDRVNSEELFETWEEYSLIINEFNNQEEWKKEIYKIFFYLEYGAYDSEFKITRKEWLTKNKNQLIDNYKDLL